MSQKMSYSIDLLHSVLHYFSVIATEDLTFPLTKMKGAEEVCNKILSSVTFCLGDEVLSKHIFSYYSVDS